MHLCRPRGASDPATVRSNASAAKRPVRRGPTRSTSVLSVAVLALAVAACGGPTTYPAPATTNAPTTTSSTVPPLSTSTKYWILSATVANQLVTDPGADAGLKGVTVLEILSKGEQPTPGLTVIPTEQFQSASMLTSAIEQHTLLKGTAAVIYDPADGAQTPPSEQQDPVTVTEGAYTVAHAHGLLMVISPNPDLMNVLTPGQRPTWRALLGSGLIGKLAQYSNIMAIQSQSLQSDSSLWIQELAQATTQAESAHPGIVLLGSLTTHVPKGAPSASTLDAAVQISAPFVSGFWLHVPVSSPTCPTCQATGVALAGGLLQSIAG